MNLKNWPFLDSLNECNSILLAGAGGGFDIYSGIPIYFLLRQLGKKVYLANLSFASLPTAPDSMITPKCTVVSADTPSQGGYFPERELAIWLRDKHCIDTSIYCFPQTGVVHLRNAYDKLISLLNLDTIILVDGGTDSLMRGDEVDLGTPSEDIASIAAVSTSGILKSYLLCIGFGIDSYHGVCHAQFLEAVADLTEMGSFLGVTSIFKGIPEADELISAIDHANQFTHRRQSIVQNSIASAIEGKFGDYHRTNRTTGSKLWINPLMSLYWAFYLKGVINRNLYIDKIINTESMYEVVSAIQLFRTQIGIRRWDQIPV